MDNAKECEHGKTHVRLKKKQWQPTSPQHNASLTSWDSTESDTESLAQERAYQHALQKQIGCDNESIALPKEDEENEDDDEEQEEEGLHVYDSLDVPTHQLDKRNNSQFSIEVLNKHQINGNKVSSDSYADLRYDPNWRTNFRGAQKFAESGLFLDEVSQNPDEKSEGSDSEREDLSTRGGYRYIIARSPALADHGRPEIMGNLLETQHPLKSYHLHHQQEHATREIPPLSPNHLHVPKNHCVRDRPLKSTHLRMSVLSEGDINRISPRKVNVKQVETNWTYTDQNPISSSESEGLFGVIQDRPAKKLWMYSDREQEQPYRTASEKLTKNSSKQKGSQHLSNRKPEKPNENIIERNKMTLGIQTAKQGGSYLKAHSQKGEKSDTSQQVTDTTDEITTAGSQEESLEDNSDPELRWLQKAQQLRVIKISKGKKAWQRGNPREKRPKAQGGKAKQEDCLSPPISQSSAMPQSYPHHHFPQQPPLSPPPQRHPPSTVHLNINLSTTSDLLPLQHQSRQDAFITLTSPQGPQWKPSPNLYHSSLPFTSDKDSPLPVSYDGQAQMSMLVPQQVALSPSTSGLRFHSRHGYPGKPCLTPSSRGVINTEPHLWHQVTTPTGLQGYSSPRLTTTKWYPSHLDSQNQSFGMERNVLQLADIPSYRPALHTAQTQQSDSSTVLPPIGKLMTGHPEPSRGNCTQRIQRSSSDGYLAQMEKQKHLKEKITYKAYTQKDYKRLRQDVKLGGLGPDYTTNEITVEKMRRQRLYSNVIREQNKKISRIPVLPARDPVGSDKKEEVPRKKALEYAKSIARPMAQPKLPSKPREREMAEVGFGEHARYLEGFDLSQLATLEHLRKRHEEEKKAVARFKVVHTV